MDEGLVKPKRLCPIFIYSLHNRHPVRNNFLAIVSKIWWWSRLHCEVLAIARACVQCQEAGKNIKTILSKTKSKPPVCTESNRDGASDFTGLFQNVIIPNKTLLVSVDHFPGCPGSEIFKKSSNRKSFGILNKLNSYKWKTKSDTIRSCDITLK